MLFIITGVSGSGKTTLGKLLTERLKLPFYDADDFHPKANIEKMKSGTSLTDTDRLPWLNHLHESLCKWDKTGGAVLACSALKESYREILNGKDTLSINWIHLIAEKSLLQKRLSDRKEHFFNPVLLDSQLNTLEVPDYGIKVEACLSLEEQLKAVLDYFKLSS